MIKHILSACALSLLALPAMAQQAKGPADNAVTQQDHGFLSYAAQDNQGEIQICLLAEKQAKEPAVKAFARLMVDDHVQIESELATVIDSAGVPVPNDVGKDAQQTLSKLEPLHGADFDRAFIAAQIEDHTHDIQRFRDERTTTGDTAVRRFADLTLPVLQQHLALAKAVQAYTKDKGS